jgi:poly(A) polymerase
MLWRSQPLNHGFRRQGRLLTGDAAVIRTDPLGVLRAAKFVAQFRLSVEASLEQRLRSLVVVPPDVLRNVEARDALSDILQAEHPAEGVALLDRLGALALYLPELEAARGVDQFGGFHHLDVLAHSIEALRRLTATFPDASLEARWATLLHDVGKPPSKVWDVVRERWSFFGHDQLGGRMARDVLSRLDYPVGFVARVSLMVDRHMVRLPGDEAAAKRFVRRNASILLDLLAVMLADREAARGPLSTEDTRQAYQRGMDLVLAAMKDLERIQPMLTGHEVMAHLGLPPGKLIGEALAVLLQAAESGEVRTPDEARARLDAWAEEIGLEGSAPAFETQAEPERLS